MGKDANITLTVPAKPEYVDLVRLTLYGIAAKMNFSFEEIEDMKVAVSEACNNAVLHAYGEEEDGTVEIEFVLVGRQELRIVVRDRGTGFDPANVPAADGLQGKSVEEIESGGLGLMLMEALMDSVEVKAGQGTSVVLTKRRAAPEKV